MVNNKTKTNELLTIKQIKKHEAFREAHHENLRSFNISY